MRPNDIVLDALSMAFFAAARALEEAAHAPESATPRLLTYKEAGELLKIGPDAVARLVASGQLPFVAVTARGKRRGRRVKLTDVESHILRHTVRNGTAKVASAR
jgi:excisionase family DNA binding protein